MILDAIISLAVAAFTAILSLIPSFSFNGGFEFGELIGTWMSTANGFFPMNTLAMCILAILGVYVFVFAVRVIVFVWDKFPFKAS